MIHVYSNFEKTTVKEWQTALGSKTYGYPTDANGTGGSAAKIPITDLNNSVLGFAFGDVDKNATPGRLANLDMTVITIEYRVKDSWDNLSSIANRRVYIYESQQYKTFAFYATPLSTINGPGEQFESFFNDNNSTPYMTSLRKDYDGDGVSDYWEAVLGTGIDNPSQTPDLSKSSTWDYLKGKSTADLLNNINRLDDARLLRHQSWLNNLDNNGSSHIFKNPLLTHLP
jgi:hypothetical protein